jgi:hypothetical protein
MKEVIIGAFLYCVTFSILIAMNEGKMPLIQHKARHELFSVLEHNSDFSAVETKSFDERIKLLKDMKENIGIELRNNSRNKELYANVGNAGALMIGTGLLSIFVTFAPLESYYCWLIWDSTEYDKCDKKEWMDRLKGAIPSAALVLKGTLLTAGGYYKAYKAKMNLKKLKGDLENVNAQLSEEGIFPKNSEDV